MFDILVSGDCRERGFFKDRDVLIKVEHFYNDYVFNKYFHKGSWYQIEGFYRGDLGDSCSALRGLHLIVVGEVFLSDKGSTALDRNPSKLNSKEVIELYEKYRMEFVDMIKGDFYILIFDDLNHQCLIFSSKYVIKPLYYFYKDNVFILSTSVAFITRLLPKTPVLDKSAVLESMMFHHPLGKRTLIEGVTRVFPGSYININGKGVQENIYADPQKLFFADKLSLDKALESGMEIFKNTARLHSSGCKSISLSLTGGFDGRALLAVLEKPREDVLCYSFGTQRSDNILIPQRIAKDLNLKYLPIQLEDEYTRLFNEYAMRALILSDGQTFERANYGYTFDKIKEFSPYVVTGIGGSEMLRTFQNAGLMVSSNFVKIIYSKSPEDTFDKILQNVMHESYFDRSLFCDKDIADLKERFLGTYSPATQKLDPHTCFHSYLIREGLRKYFGAELQTERLYATTRIPYLDDDFVAFLFTTPFAGVNTTPIKPTASEKIRSQKLYAHIIHKYSPGLLQYPTDHGYPPKYLLSKYPLMKISPRFIVHRAWRKLSRYQEFYQVKWCQGFFDKNLHTSRSDKLMNLRFDDDAKSGRWQNNFLEFTKAVSMKLWLKRIGGVVVRQ